MSTGQMALAIGAWFYVFVLLLLILSGRIPPERVVSAWITFFVFFIVAFMASIYKEKPK